MSLKPLIFLLFFLSGAAALVYEVLWLRMLILIFGSTQLAVSTILTAFMAGLALGAWLLGRAIDRRGDPVRVYALLEIGIGLYALLVPALFGALVPISRALWGSFEPHFVVFSLLRFAFVTLVLIVPCALMGGTLPVLSRLAAGRPGAIGASIGWLYAVNTLGAVAGTAATGFLLIPRFGMSRTLLFAAALNAAIGLAALLARRVSGGATPPTPVQPEHEAGPPSEPGRDAPAARALLWALAGSGFVAMVYEVAWARVLALVIGSSVYAFTLMLATFLAGLAGGAAIMARFADRLPGRRAIAALVALLVLTSLAAFMTMLLFAELPYQFTLWYQEARRAGGLLFLLNLACAAAVMLPPTLILGGILPLGMRALAEGRGGLGRSVGRAYAWNTMGTIAGSFLAGFVLIPLLGIRGCVLLGILADLALAGVLVIQSQPGLSPRLLRLAALTLLAVVMVLFAPSWNTMVMNSGVYQYANDMADTEVTRETFRGFMVDGYQVRFYEEGMTTSVTVMEEIASKALLLAVNGKIDASSHGDLPTQILSGHVPLLVAENPGKVLVVGFASGITVGAVTRHPVQKITAVEIEPAVLAASRFFDDLNHRPLDDPRVRVVRDDGRNFLQMDEGRYDVIISEPSNPWMTVASNLFTREFFEIGRRRLVPGGVFAQWLQLYGMAPEDLKVMMRTFQASFPHVLVFNPIEDADLLLVGSERPLGLDLRALSARMARPEVAEDLARVGVTGPADLLSYFLFGQAELTRLTGPGPLNTDDNALIEFRAPRSLHEETRGPNVALLQEAEAGAGSYVSGLKEEESGRDHAVRMAEAFMRRRQWRRARAALAAHPGLAESEEGLAMLRRIEEAERVDTGRTRG